MAKIAACPDVGEFQNILQGKFGADKLENLVGHLEQCEPCAQTVEQLLATDTVAEAMKVKAIGTPKGEEGRVQQLVQRLQALRAAESHATANDHTISVSEVAGTRTEGDPQECLAPPQDAGEIGRLGGYRVIRVLGEGGMGLVYQAEDVHLQRPVALKVMRGAAAKNPSSRERFLREARAAARVHHDNIVTIYQVGEDRGVPFLAMEFLEGMPLNHLLEKGRKLSIAQVLRIGKDIAAGLAAAHEKQLLHRDIKPGNIWLDKNSGRAKLLDFGLARTASDATHLTKSGMIVGTPAYMAPEQGRADKVDHRCDLFSLGCVLYELSTGKRPFTGPDTIGILMSLAVDTPPAPHLINFDVPPGLSDLIMQLLEKDPAKRPASAKMVIAALIVLQKSQVTKSESAAAATEPSVRAGSVSDRSSSPLPHGRGSDNPPGATASAAFAFSAINAPQAAMPRPATQERKRPALVAALVLLGGLFIIAAGVFGIIHITTPEGDYIIDTDDPDFSFSVSKGTVILEDKKSKRTYNLKVVHQDKAKGEFELEVTDADSGLVFNTKTFTIKRGQQVALKAWFERKEPPAAKGTPVDDAWLKMVAAMPADKQVDAVAAKLKELNPGFDGKVTPTIDETGVVTELRFFSDKVKDISPVRALAGLRVLYCNGSGPDKSLFSDLSPLKDMKLTTLICRYTKVADLSALKDMKLTTLICSYTMVADLSALKDMKLTHLDCGYTQVKDLSPLKDMKLTRLGCYSTQVTDLSPLKDMKLTTLSCFRTEVADLTPLKGMKLKELGIANTKVADLSLLKGMPLKVLGCDFKADRDAEILRSIKTLETINDKPAATFWKEVDSATALPGTNALQFDGKSSHVSIPSLKYKGNHPLTLEAWAILDRPTTDHSLEVLMGDPEAAGVCINSGPKKWQFFAHFGGYQHAWEKKPVPRHKLVHLAGVYDGTSEIRFYVDGDLQSKTSVKAKYKESPMPFTLGANPDPGGKCSDHFLGKIVEVRISKVARYDGEFTPKKRCDSDKDTLALYHFDEGAGDVLKDSSGNNHHGKIVGAKWVRADGSPITAGPAKSGQSALTAKKTSGTIPAKWRATP